MKYKRSKCPTPSHKQFHKRAAKARRGESGCAVVVFAVCVTIAIGAHYLIQVIA